MAKKEKVDVPEELPEPTVGQISINTIYEMLRVMPNWKQLNVQVVDSGTHVEFSRGNVVLGIPYMELLVVGAKTIYKMMRCLDEQ